MDFYYSYDINRDGPVPFIVSLVVLVIAIIALWRVFQKAGRPGWAAIIPIYNVYTLIKVGGFHGALTILYYIPIVGIIVHLVVSIGVAKNFGKSGAFGFFLLWLLSLIGLLILGFGKAQYIGEKPVKA